MIRKNPIKFFLLALILIALDQGVKLAVHFYMAPGFAGQVKLIGDWLKLHYVLNPGMAFGMQLGYEYGKLLLSVFRLFAMVGIGYYLVHLAHRGAPNGLLWAMSMILAGAVGNVIDSTFYGVFLNNAPYGSPTPWFHGQVIDMIFVDVWEGFIPDWMPVWGGQYYSTPIFNIADSCIFIGVCLILLFQRRFFGGHTLEMVCCLFRVLMLHRLRYYRCRNWLLTNSPEISPMSRRIRFQPMMSHKLTPNRS